MVAWPSPSTDRYKVKTSFFSTEIPAALEPPPPPRLVPARTVVYRFFHFFHSRGTRDLGGGGGERSTAGRHRKKTAAAAAAPHARVSGSRRVQRAWVGRERGEYGTLYMCASLSQSHPTQVMDVSKRARPGRGGAAGAGKRWHCITWPTGPGSFSFQKGGGGGGGVVCLRASPSLASLLLLVFVRRPLAGLPSSFRHDDDGFRRTTAWALVHHHKQRDKQVRYVVGALGAHRMSGHAPSSLLSGRYMDGRWPAAGEEEGDASAVVREGRSFFHAMQSGWRARAGRSGDAGCFDVLCGWGERDGSGAQVPRPACA